MVNNRNTALNLQMPKVAISLNVKEDNILYHAESASFYTTPFRHALRDKEFLAGVAEL